MRIALINSSGLVTNTIVAKSVAFIEANADKWPHDIAVDITDVQSNVGDTYNGDGTFSEAPEPAQRYETVMDAQTFLLLLSPEELELLRLSSNPILVATEYLFRIRNGEVNTESDIFKDVMQAARDEKIISAARAKELSKGRPV